MRPIDQQPRKACIGFIHRRSPNRRASVGSRHPRRDVAHEQVALDVAGRGGPPDNAVRAIAARGAAV
jgi:hypothetical protein